MPISTPFHERTFPLCTSLSYGFAYRQAFFARPVNKVDHNQ